MKKFNKFAAAAASGLLTVSTLGMNVFADYGDIPTSSDANTLKVKIAVDNKNEMAVTPNLTGFVKFDVEAGEAPNETGYYAGTPDTQLSISDPIVQKEGDELTYSYEGSISVNPTGFEHYGVYVYKLSENISNEYAGLQNGNLESKNLYLQVTDTGYTWFVGDVEGAKGEDPVFNAEYVTYDLTVNKTVSGALANKKQKFDFNATVTKDVTNGIDSYNTRNASLASDEDGNPISGTFEAQLAAGESFTIYGIPAGYSYTTSEDLSADEVKGYESTVTDGFANGSIKGTTNVTYNNDLDLTAATPTGIVKTTAPFALMLAVAGAFAAMFFRRKTEE